MAPPFRFQLDEGWDDITDEVDVPPPPWTFARPEGNGAFQISIAGLYVGGEAPNPSSHELMQMLLSSATAQEHGNAANLLREDGRIRIAAATCCSLEWQMRLWYFSDGYSIGQASWTTGFSAQPDELAACERMVRSIEIERVRPPGTGF